MYSVIKRYGYEQGFSCCFRQHEATSHCNQLHGYALAFELEFCALELDSRNWVIDFGSLQSVKALLAEHFDHTLAVAQSDPMADIFVQLHSKYRVASPVLFPEVGCEAFARFVYGKVYSWLRKQKWNEDHRVWLHRVRVSEHNGNHAEYIGLLNDAGDWEDNDVN